MVGTSIPIPGSSSEDGSATATAVPIPTGQSFERSYDILSKSYVTASACMMSDAKSSFPLNGSAPTSTTPIPVAPHPSSSLGNSEELEPIQSLKSDETIVEEEKRLQRTPFSLLPGEEQDWTRPLEGGTRLWLTNYRLMVLRDEGGGGGDQERREAKETKPDDGFAGALISVPLLEIDTVDAIDSQQLLITCKQGRVNRLRTANVEEATDLYRRLTPRRQLRTELFAWKFAAKCLRLAWLPLPEDDVRWGDTEWPAQLEFQRLGFPLTHFRVSDANADFLMCESYPASSIVPQALTDADLRAACTHRFLNRWPVVVWRNAEKKSYLLRSSQPKTALLSWRNSEDERILRAVVDATDAELKSGPPDANERPDDDQMRPKRLFIMDARSYAAAFANRAKGGGYEPMEYYPDAEICFMGLPNIHSVRYSFAQLRTLLSKDIDQHSYWASVQSTNWLTYLSALLQAAERVVDTLDQGISVLVHCSDGWDRTTQIVSLAKLIADPYYRTRDGFECLVRREWIAYGHKCADRAGMGVCEAGERAPVFLQWLDAVRTLVGLDPKAFEFTQLYLVKLARHAYSGLFGTFLFNSIWEARRYRIERAAAEVRANRPAPPELISVWRYLSTAPEFVNKHYENHEGRLYVQCGVERMSVWLALYDYSRPGEKTVNCAEQASAATNGAAATATAMNSATMTENGAENGQPSMDRSLARSKSIESVTSQSTETTGSTTKLATEKQQRQPSKDITDPDDQIVDDLERASRLANCPARGSSTRLSTRCPPKFLHQQQLPHDNRDERLDVDGLVLVHDSNACPTTIAGNSNGGSAQRLRTRTETQSSSSLIDATQCLSVTEEDLNNGASFSLTSNGSDDGATAEPSSSSSSWVQRRRRHSSYSRWICISTSSSPSSNGNPSSASSSSSSAKSSTPFGSGTNGSTPVTNGQQPTSSTAVTETSSVAMDSANQAQCAGCHSRFSLLARTRRCVRCRYRFCEACSQGHFPEASKSRFGTSAVDQYICDACYLDIASTDVSELHSIDDVAMATTATTQPQQLSVVAEEGQHSTFHVHNGDAPHTLQQQQASPSSSIVVVSGCHSETTMRKNVQRGVSESTADFEHIAPTTTSA